MRRFRSWRPSPTGRRWRARLTWTCCSAVLRRPPVRLSSFLSDRLGVADRFVSLPLGLIVVDPTFDFGLDASFIKPSSSSASPFSTLNVNPQPPALNSVDPSAQIVSLEGRAQEQVVVFEEILKQSRRLHSVEIKDVAPVVRDHLFVSFLQFCIPLTGN